jgi:hypothetical protein
MKFNQQDSPCFHQTQDSKSREETLESTAAELEKELKFWQRRSDEDLEELLQWPGSNIGNHHGK